MNRLKKWLRKKPVKDKFDEQYEFMLKYGLTSKEKYNMVKSFYFQHQEAFHKIISSSEEDQCQ
jgi:hypothetical protein